MTGRPRSLSPEVQMARNAATNFEDDSLTKRRTVKVEVALPGEEPISLQTPFPWIGAEWGPEHLEEDLEW